MKDVSNRKVILLAEDDSDDRELFTEAISLIGQDVTLHCAENGRDALNRLSELDEKPDLIFLDINMPVMNGWQCLKSLKEDQRYKDIPVIIYSSSSHQKEKEIAVELGALSFFTKPSDFYEFKQTLEGILKK